MSNRTRNLFNARERIRFALASYNCGAGPNKWFGHVEKSMLLLSKKDVAKKVRYGYCRCEEPVNYVSQIQNRYDHYAQIAPTARRLFGIEARACLCKSIIKSSCKTACLSESR